jgi:uncharacterized membrane protein YkoI
MKTVWSVGVAAVALALSAGALKADAQVPRPRVSQVDVDRSAPRHARVSMDKAVRLAQRRFRARVVRAETQTQGDRTIYVLRMLDSHGRVFAVRVDAVSGAIL